MKWRPILAAGSVLLLWLAWVLLPDPSGPIRNVATATSPLPVATDVVLVAPTGAAALQPAPSAAASPAGVVVPPDRAVVPPDGAVEVSGPVPTVGSGALRLAGGSSAVFGGGPTVVRYSVEVEAEVPLDPAAVAARIDQILGDQRSWIGLGRWTLQRVDSGADARIVVATPETVDRLCLPLQTSGRYSCRNGPVVVLNAQRWATGADSWGADVDGYRGYLVNHEFGHYLGYSHTTCPGAGEPSPVMVQQTKSLFGCVANAWPTVTGG